MFPTAPHLASWAGGNHESAGKRNPASPAKATPHLQPFLVEAAWAAARTEGRLKARYDRLVRRFGGYRRPEAKNKAIFAITHTLAVII